MKIVDALSDESIAHLESMGFKVTKLSGKSVEIEGVKRGKRSKSVRHKKHIESRPH